MTVRLHSYLHLYQQYTIRGGGANLGESGESQELTLGLLDTGDLSGVGNDAWVHALGSQLGGLGSVPLVVSGNLGPQVGKLEGLLLLLVEGDGGVVEVNSGDGHSLTGGGAAEGVVGADGGGHTSGVPGSGGNGGQDGGQDCENLHLSLGLF